MRPYLFPLVLLTGLILLTSCSHESAETSISERRELVRYDMDGTTRAVVVQGYPLVHTRQLLPFDDAGKLVGDGVVESQVDQVLANLEIVLNENQSGLDKLVRLNIYANEPETADLVRESLRQRMNSAQGPVITAVQTPLPDPTALVAVDAVAVGSESSKSVDLKRSEQLSGSSQFADAAVLPAGGVVYLSGQADKSGRAEATANSLRALFDRLDQLNLDRSHVVQLKVFIDSATAADEVLREVQRVFSGQLIPPVVFVEWIASAPVEIEMIAQSSHSAGPSSESVRYYNPPDVKASPTFSRVALVESDRQIYISGLTSRATGNGEEQTRDVFDQLQGILSLAGSDLLHLAKATYYVSDDDASNMLNQIRPEFYDPARPPAASKAMVHGVGRPQRTLMLDMIAVGVPVPKAGTSE